jgi:hypothetical protein
MAPLTWCEFRLSDVDGVCIASMVVTGQKIHHQYDIIIVTQGQQWLS